MDYKGKLKEVREMAKLISVTDVAYNHLRDIVAPERKAGYSATMASEASKAILAVNNGNQQSATSDSRVRG